MNNLDDLKKEIAITIRAYNSKGWSPATSTNYSFKTDDSSIYVSRSGVDKSIFSENDFITIDKTGTPIGEDSQQTPSAETLIHCVLYELFPETRVILHSHSVYPILLSQQVADFAEFEGYELQKGFTGQTTHDATIQIPVFENTQNINEFSEFLRSNSEKLIHHSFIMRKHGTYAWGKTLFEAKRHLETLDYLCQCAWILNNK